MARWAIWLQVGFAVVGCVANLADRGKIPLNLCPPLPILIPCFLSAPVLPAVVLMSGGRGKSRIGRDAEIVATLGLALTTLFALLPLVE